MVGGEATARGGQEHDGSRLNQALGFAELAALPAKQRAILGVGATGSMRRVAAMTLLEVSWALRFWIAVDCTIQTGAEIILTRSPC